MASIPTTIKLTGQLGSRFGREHRLFLDTKTPAEAVRALCVLLPGFERFLMTAKQKGLEFAVWRGQGKSAENIGIEQLREPAGDVIRIAAVVAGAKSGGVLTTIVGAVLIVIGAIGETWGQSFGGGVWGPIAMKLGIAMVAGGVVQMLSPQPRLNKSADSADNQASYVFNGPVNTSAQGNPVPVLYGRMKVGSAVISAGMIAEDYKPANAGVGNGTAGGGNKKTPYDLLD